MTHGSVLLYAMFSVWSDVSVEFTVEQSRQPLVKHWLGLGESSSQHVFSSKCENVIFLWELQIHLAHPLAAKTKARKILINTASVSHLQLLILCGSCVHTLICFVWSLTLFCMHIVFSVLFFVLSFSSFYVLLISAHLWLMFFSLFFLLATMLLFLLLSPLTTATWP